MDTHKRASTDKMLAGNYASDDRVDQMRRARRQREVQQELEMERQIEEALFIIIVFLLFVVFIVMCRMRCNENSSCWKGRNMKGGLENSSCKREPLCLMRRQDKE